MRGYDAGKQVKGRKRHIVVDTMGLVLNVLVHEASLSESWGATRVLAPLTGRFPRLRILRADAGYQGGLASWVERVVGLRLEVVRKPAGQKGFAVLPKRWVVPGPAPARADVCVVGALPASVEGLRGATGLRGGVHPLGDDGAHAAPATPNMTL